MCAYHALPRLESGKYDLFLRLPYRDVSEVSAIYIYKHMCVCMYKSLDIYIYICICFALPRLTRGKYDVLMCVSYRDVSEVSLIYTYKHMFVCIYKYLDMYIYVYVYVLLFHVLRVGNMIFSCVYLIEIFLK